MGTFRIRIIYQSLVSVIYKVWVNKNQWTPKNDLDSLKTMKLTPNEAKRSANLLKDQNNKFALYAVHSVMSRSDWAFVQMTNAKWVVVDNDLWQCGNF